MDLDGDSRLLEPDSSEQTLQLSESTAEGGVPEGLDPSAALADPIFSRESVSSGSPSEVEVFYQIPDRNTKPAEKRDEVSHQTTPIPPKTDTATQTNVQIPKLYLTETWKFLSLVKETPRPPVDFRYYQLMGAMRNVMYEPCVPDRGADYRMEDLQSESNFMRTINELSSQKLQPYPDCDALMRHEIYLGEKTLTDRKLDIITQAADDFWFLDDPKIAETEIVNNKSFLKDWIKTSDIFTADEISRIIHLKRARKKLPKALFAGTNRVNKDDLLQYKVGSSKTNKAQTESSVPAQDLSDLPPESSFSHPIPIMKDDPDFSVENLSELTKEIFGYARKQKALVQADSMVFYTVKKIDGPIVVMEQYPPRRPSPNYVRPVPDSLQYGFQPASLLRHDHSTADISTSERESAHLVLPSRHLTTTSSTIQPSKSQLHTFLALHRRGTLIKDPNVLSDLTIDFRNTDDILCQVLLEQTWMSIVCLHAYLAHGHRFLPNVAEEANSALLIPVGIHDGRMLGLIAFFRNTEKPDFTEDECNVLFTHISILTRYRYYTGVRNEQRKAEEKMMRDMHLVLQLKESATEEFLHHTLMLVKNLTDADRSSSFLVNTLSESLRAEQQLIPHHLGTGAIDPISGRPFYRRGHDIRMSVERGIVGCAFRHRKTYASITTQDNKSFFTEMDKMLANKTECLVCVPFIMGQEPFGMVEVLNKRSSSSFSDQDISMLHLNSIFPAVGVLLAWYRFHANKQEYLTNLSRAKMAYMRKRQYHRSDRTWRMVDTLREVPELPDITHHMTEPSFFYVDYLDQSVPLAVALIMDAMTSFRLNATAVYNLVESVRNWHFRTKFKDWKQAFATLQAVYVVIQQTEDFFGDEEKLMMMVAGLCHGIDHFWYNAALGEGTDVPRGFAHVFSTTTPDVSSVYAPTTVLRNPLSNLLGMYKDKAWRKLVDNCRNCVSASQLPGLLLRAKNLKNLVATKKLGLQDVEHRQLVREFITAAAALNFVCRPLELCQEIVLCAYEEYTEIVQELATDHNAHFCPRWLLPQDPKQLLPLQMEFLRDFCLPIFDTLRTLFPACKGFYDCCAQNLDRMGGAVGATGSAATPTKRLHRRYNISEETKEKMRRDLFSPVVTREYESRQWTPLQDMEYITRRPHHRY